MSQFPQFAPQQSPQFAPQQQPPAGPWGQGQPAPTQPPMQQNPVGQGQWGQHQPPPVQQPPAQGMFTPPPGGGGFGAQQRPTALFRNITNSNPSQNNVFDHGGGRYWQVIRKVRMGVNNSNQGFTAVDKEVIRVIDLKPVLYGIHPMSFGETTTHMFSEKHLPSAGNWLAFLMATTGQPIEWCRDINNTFQIVEKDLLCNMVVEVDSVVDLTRQRRQPITKPNYVRVVPPDEVRATLDDATINRFFPHGQLDKLIENFCKMTGRPPMQPLPVRIGQGQMPTTAPMGAAPAMAAPVQQWQPAPAPQQGWQPQPMPMQQPQPQWQPVPAPQPPPQGPQFGGYIPQTPAVPAQAPWQQPPQQAPAPWQGQAPQQPQQAPASNGWGGAAAGAY